MANLSSSLQLPFYFQYNKQQVFLPKHLFNYSFRNIKPVIILMEGAETEIKLSWAHVFSWQLVISWMEKTPVQWGILIIMFQISPLIYFTVFKHIYRWKAITFKASHHSLPRNYGEDVTSSLIYRGQAQDLPVWRVQARERGDTGECSGRAPSTCHVHPWEEVTCSSGTDGALGLCTLVKIKIVIFQLEPFLEVLNPVLLLKQFKKV